jgi:hypothetical protein
MEERRERRRLIMARHQPKPPAEQKEPTRTPAREVTTRWLPAVLFLFWVEEGGKVWSGWDCCVYLLSPRGLGAPRLAKQDDFLLQYPLAIPVCMMMM